MNGDHDGKLRFLKDEIFKASILGAFGRNKVYENKNVSISEKKRDEFRGNIKLLLERQEIRYKNKISEGKHLEFLNNLKNKLEKKYKNILKNGELSFGTIQKIVNLYLKYLWCLKLIDEPPHCPIDRKILKKIREYEVNWTNMNEEEYCRVIEKIKEKISGKTSIATWELREYNKSDEYPK